MFHFQSLLDRAGALERIIGAASLLAVHEAGTLRGHLAAAEERLRIARQARGLGELLRDQADLLPESRNRMRRNRAVRRELWRGVMRDLRPPQRSR